MNTHRAFHCLWAFLLLTTPLSAAEEAKTIGKEAKGDAAHKVGDQDDQANLNYMRGRQRVLEGKLEEAVPLLEEALKSDPENSLVNHQLAEIFMKLSQFERAEVHGKKAVDKEPKNLEFRGTLGSVYAQLKRYPEAKEQYRKIIDLDPTNPKAPLFLGIIEADSGDVPAGIKTLTKAIEENPENYMALFYRAKLHLEVEDDKKAKADLDRCLTIRPGFVEAGHYLGMLHEKLGEMDEAIKAYGRIQGNGRFRKRLAQLYLQRNEFEKALAELLEYEKSEPDDYTARVKIGLIYFELRKFDKASERFLTILKEQPTADNVRFYLGAVYEEMKQLDKAAVEFRKVSKESTFYKEANLHLGVIYRERGKYKEGIRLAKKLIAEFPEVVEYYDMHAAFYEAQKEYKKALTVIAEGLTKHPSDEKLLYFEGALQDKTGNREKAIENMKKILVTNANSAHALNFLGYTYAEMGQNLDEAEALIRKAQELRPNDGFIEDSLGWVLFKKGKVEEAMIHLERASTLQPEEAIIFEHLGDCYLHQKKFAKASESYKKAVAYSKKDKEMTRKLEAKLQSSEKESRLPSAESAPTPASN